MKKFGAAIKVNREELYACMLASTKNLNLGKHLPFFQVEDVGHREHFIVLDRKQIVAVGAVRVSKWYENTLRLSYVSVHAQHRNKGHARRIVSAIFNEAVRKDMVLMSSEFTEMGDLYLRPMMAKLHGAFPALKIRWRQDRPETVDGTRRYTLHNSSIDGCDVRFVPGPG